MMDYELFKRLVSSRIKEYMPPVFHDYRVDVREVTKVNEIKEAFCLFPPDPQPWVAIPTLYMDDLYEDFQEDEDLERVLQMSAAVFLHWSGVRAPGLAEFGLTEHTDCIAANLIGADQNEALLKKVPHTDFLDMAVIYRLVHSASEEGINSAIITNDMLNGSDLTARDLHRLAMENTPRLFPARILESTEEGVCVMTNEFMVCGATTMLYADEMQRLARSMGGDFFIMPTSMHEFFAIRAELADVEHLSNMLREGNATVTRSEDRLSQRIYRYLAKEGRIEAACA